MTASRFRSVAPTPTAPTTPTAIARTAAFDLYDFRSENEHRRTDVIDLSVQGKLQTGSMSHALTAGVQQSKVRNRFQQQAYNYVGAGNVDGTAFWPADPTLSYESTNRTNAPPRSTCATPSRSPNT